jgi:hypothetical protein
MNISLTDFKLHNGEIFELSWSHPMVCQVCRVQRYTYIRPDTTIVATIYGCTIWY